jgi:formate dehydrogenase iron-sulfur subunit
MSPSCTTVWVPRDASARSVGADEVADAIAAHAAAIGVEVRIVRNGSRGMLWLEPLVEVATDARRIAYGPVGVDDVASLFAAGFLAGGEHPLKHGATESIPYFAKQQRLTFARVGLIDPVSVAEYEAHGGLRGLRAALALEPAQIVEAVLASGLRGRGGAAFPTGIKWKTVLDTAADQKYVVCNADEGDSGTFSDRMVMEGDPLVLVEGMIIAGLATGATQGYIYLRSEYPDAAVALNQAIAAARAAGVLGPDVLGSGRRFELEVRIGAGSYVCGEETALLESLEGKRGIVRYRPPVPAVAGLWGKPTALNNVVTFASVPIAARRTTATSGPDDRAARWRSSSPATSPGAAWSSSRSASPCASCCTSTAAARRAADRSVRCRSEVRSAPSCPRRISICRSTTRRSWPRAPSSATAASWCSTTPSTWPRWPATRWNSARSSRAASARRAASVPRAVSR